MAQKALSVLDFNNAALQWIHPSIGNINAGLRLTAQTWVPMIFPEGERSGFTIRVKDVHTGERPSKVGGGSVVISLIGPYAGHATDWAPHN